MQAQAIDGAHPVDFYFLTGSGSAHDLYGTTHLVVGTRYYIAATYDGTNIKLYVNGVLESSGSAPGPLYYRGGGLGIGRKYSDPTANFTGTEQGVAIYNAALTAAQISAHYAAGPPTPVYKLSQVPSGGTTLSGSASYQPTAVTVASWINAPATLTNYPAFISYGIDTSPYESYILQANRIDGTKPVDFYFLTGTGTSHQLFGNTHLSTGTQYFVVATYDGAAANLYINGSLDSTLSASGSLYYPSGVGLGVARKYTNTSNNFTGTESGVAIFGSALTADRIAAQYQAGSPPTIPTSLTATAASSSQINVSWTGSSDVVGVTGYLIERCSGSGCTAFTQVANGTSTSYSDTGLTASTSYTYRVRAVNAGNNVSDYSATSSIATSGFGGGSGDTTPPSTPANLTATTNSTSQITLTWTASTDNVGVTGYKVERCSGSGCSSFTQVGTPSASPYADSALSAGTTYTYRIRATDAAGNLSAYSATATATTNSTGDTTPPSAPSGLSANAGANSASLSWTSSTDNVGVTAYLIERCQGSGCSSFSQVGTSSTNSYSDTGLAASTSYSYRVRATDAAGNYSGYSNIASATTQTVVDTIPPTNPTNLAVTGGSGSAINLGWTGSTDNIGVTAYLLERCQGTNCSNFVQIAAPTTSGYTDSGVAASTPYAYRVKARDAANNQSGYSNMLNLVTPPSGGVCTP